MDKTLYAVTLGVPEAEPILMESFAKDRLPAPGSDFWSRAKQVPTNQTNRKVRRVDQSPERSDGTTVQFCEF